MALKSAYTRAMGEWAGTQKRLADLANRRVWKNERFAIAPGNFYDTPN